MCMLTSVHFFFLLRHDFSKLELQDEEIRENGSARSSESRHCCSSYKA